MSGREVIQTLFDFLEKGQIEEARRHLSGDFLFLGWTPQPLTKSQFLALTEALQKSMPDLRFHALSIVEDDQLAQSDRVLVAIQLTGTQTGRFFLPPYDLSPCAAAPRTIAFPQEQISCTVMGDTVESMIVSPAKNRLEEIVTALTSGEMKPQPQQATSATEGWPEPDAKGLPAQPPAEARRLYEKQSNLYDPQGDTATPSHPHPNPDPQVDPSSTSSQPRRP